MKKGMVSVVVPNYNYGHFLGETIESVVAQTYKNWELIIVDDNSSDDSREIVEEYIKKYPQFDITLFHNKKGPSGTSTPINIGIRNMAGEYFAWLSSDDAFLPEKLEEQVKFLEANPNVGLVYTSFLVMDDDSVVYRENVVTEYPRAEFFINLFERNMINGNTILVRKKVYDTVGLYQETHPLFPAIWIVSDYPKYWETLMHFEIAAMRKKLHKTRLHRGNKIFAATSLGKETAKVVRKLFLKEYPISKILEQLNIPGTERARYLMRLWDVARRDSIESSFMVDYFNEKEGDLLERMEQLEYIKLGIRISTQLVFNRKVVLAKKQIEKTNSLIKPRDIEFINDLKFRESLEILNEGKRLFKEGDIDLSEEIFQLIAEDDFVPRGLKISGLYYLASVLKEKGKTGRLSEVLGMLLALEPYHVKGRIMLREIGR